ncbi:DUF4962 domain-containing protein [Lentisphaera profundi]|uniref:DUF4962 domain-containing protein n=1 Tax=Lentisphaera profundi TaxID=1658616 RepID=A0ABY7VMG7_9BACT|nr:DUF4962 domain-containing protein [Lentisphaera profundi]WDE95205.1 DUF4962 domain-containing protein [Lentisphaera profundi]
MKFFQCCVLFLSLSLWAEPYSPFPKYRSQAFPNQDTVHINPPPFLWPAKTRTSSYVVEISRDENFTKIEKISKQLLQACYINDEKFSPGKWFWRLVHEDGQVAGPYSFKITDQPVFVTPSYEVFENNIPSSHPRFLTQKSELEQKQILLKDSTFQEEILSQSKIFINQAVPSPQAMNIPKGELKPHEHKRLLINKAKSFLGRRLLQCSYLSSAYLINRDEKFAEKAVENALFIANLDKKYQHLNDFTESMCLNSLVIVFDNCYDYLNEQQKQKMLEKIQDFSSNYYAHMRNNVEMRVFDNHAWQKTINTLFKSALVSKGHLPEANEWLEFCYEIWRARAPASGFNLDGAWVNGSGYFTANIVTLIQMPTLLSRYTGVNFFEHPWFKNAPYALMMTWPANSYSSGFGDGHGSPTNPRWKQAMLVKAIASETQNGEAQWFYEEMKSDPQCNKQLHAKNNPKHPLDVEFIEWFAVVENNKEPQVKIPRDLTAALFPNSGFASLHSNYLEPDKNIFISLRSSLYGSGSHTSCDQNAFNIIAGGEALFLGAGHYTNFSDKHNLLQYRHTRGANSILADKIGQSIGTHSYGEIIHFEDKEDYTYVVADASAAYSGKITDPMWHKKMKEAGVEASRENAYGETGLKKFIRHLIYIKPSTLIIYDDLEADKPITWTWMLHSPQEMTLDDNFLYASNSQFKSRVSTFSEQALAKELSDKFYSPAINWSQRKIHGEIVEYDNQWHFEASTPKLRKTAFLSIIQLKPKNQKFQELKIKTAGKVIFGDWKIIADLSAKNGIKLIKNNQLLLSSFQKSENNHVAKLEE